MKRLIAYFSREGENYVNGSIVNLAVGNTEVARILPLRDNKGRVFAKARASRRH